MKAIIALLMNVLFPCEQQESPIYIQNNKAQQKHIWKDMMHVLAKKKYNKYTHNNLSRSATSANLDSARNSRQTRTTLLYNLLRPDKFP